MTDEEQITALIENHNLWLGDQRNPSWLPADERAIEEGLRMIADIRAEAMAEQREKDAEICEIQEKIAEERLRNPHRDSSAETAVMGVTAMLACQIRNQD